METPFQGGRSEFFEYQAERDGTARITRWYGADPVLSIPVEIDGLKVSGIATGAFSVSPQLREVIIPEGITEIEAYAFAFCPALEKVTLPESLRRLDDRAFASCPDTVVFIAPEGSYAAERIQ